MNQGSLSPNDVTAIVLCGGKGSRIDGQDKPLLKLGDQRMVDHICERLEPQVAEIVISCSRNVAIYEALHHRLAIDRELNQGPLAGITEAFKLVNTEWAFTTPGDTPYIALDIVARLSIDASRAGVAVPNVDGIRQNLCLLINAEQRQKLTEFHAEGGNAVKNWLDERNVESTEMSDIAPNFLNVNTHQDLAQATEQMATRIGDA